MGKVCGIRLALFDWYAFADYSGARSPAEQRRHIALAVDEGGGSGGDFALIQGVTRDELLVCALELLRRAVRNGKRMILGFDHNYSFPSGFHEAVYGEFPADWRAVAEGFAETAVSSGWGWTGQRGASGWSPRDWANRTNEVICASLGVAAGPFWGTLFGRRPEPELFGTYRLADGAIFEFRERRLVEERYRRLKPPYQLGGIGSVGQQSLYGMLYLRELLQVCGEESIPVHVWPMDGTDIPEGSHVLAEVYPSLYLEPGSGPRSDATDALACVRWVSAVDRVNQLGDKLALDGFTEEEWRRVRLEGWVLGLPPSGAPSELKRT